MPKDHADFPCTLVTQVECELRVWMKALGAYRGNGKVYAAAVRECLWTGLDLIKSKMSPEELDRLNRIYKNIAIKEGLEFELDELLEEVLDDRDE